MSSQALRRTLIVLTLLGIAVASYLTYIHYAGIKPLCGRNGGGCEIVQTSQYSKLLGVPVALIGLLGYIAILGSLLVPQNESARLATTAFTTIGVGFSLYLTYRELFSIHHICEYCVSSAVIVTVLMCLSIWQFLRGEQTAPRASDDGGAQTAATEPAARLRSAS